MQAEVCPGAELPVFAEKFLELFGEKIHDKPQQMNKCLKLYGQFTED